MKKYLLLLTTILFSSMLFSQTVTNGSINSLNIDPGNTNNGNSLPGLNFGLNSGEGLASKRTSGGNQNGLDVYTNAASRLSITNTGFIGIGTASPQKQLSIATGMNIDQLNRNQGTIASNTLTFGSSSGEGIGSNRGNGNQYGLDFYTNFAIRFSITNAGKVGIGTIMPEKQLSLGGGMNIDQSNSNNGALNSSTLTFGSASGEGIGSNRSGGGNNPWGLDFYAGGNNRMVITNGGNVGIGTNAPGMKLTVNGNILAYGSITPSDIRYKKNLVPVNNALKKLMSISGYYYSFKANEFPDMGFDTKKQIGVIAQDVEKVAPEVVITLQNGYKAVDYPKLIPLMIEGMKEQQQMIEKQQMQIDELKKIVVALTRK
ncbi:MAG: tail fiber domain-containing protein [Bacteroidota bacterium]